MLDRCGRGTRTSECPNQSEYGSPARESHWRGDLLVSSFPTRPNLCAPLRPDGVRWCSVRRRDSTSRAGVLHRDAMRDAFPPPCTGATVSPEETTDHLAADGQSECCRFYTQPPRHCPPRSRAQVIDPDLGGRSPRGDQTALEALSGAM